MADGPPEIPAQRIEKSQSRTSIGGAELQSQTSGPHPRRARAATSARALKGLRRILVPLKTPPGPSVAKTPTSHTAWKAGTHSHRYPLLESRLPPALNRNRHGVWVPAFAG